MRLQLSGNSPEAGSPSAVAEASAPNSSIFLRPSTLILRTLRKRFTQPGPGAHFWKLSRKISLGYRAPEAEDALQKLTVPKLQAFLRKHRQKTSGRKAELVQQALEVPAWKDLLARDL